MKDENALYWLWLADRCGPASKQFLKIIEKYESPFEVYMLEDSEVEQMDFLTPKQKEKLCDKSLNDFYERIRECQQNNIDIITYGDSRYPACLGQMEDPPIVLYCRGHFPDFNSRLYVGVVGTRKMSEYGKEMAFRLGYELAAANAVAVSGMALGVDGVAACGALAGGGETVAILGCGVDIAYPKAHEALMEEITRHGAVISEYPPKEEPRSYNFPKRNRLISGLCRGVLVVEAAEKSGALITAADAFAQGRQVFAVPGKVSDKGAKGPNDLLLKGAVPTVSAIEIIKNYELFYGEQFEKEKYLSLCAQMPEVDKVLLQYGLDYGTQTPYVEEKIYDTKPKGKRKPAKAAEPEEKKSVPVSAPIEPSVSPIVEELDEITRKIYDSIPSDRAISVEKVYSQGLNPSAILTSLSLLEIYGLVSSLPGGMYIRK